MGRAYRARTPVFAQEMSYLVFRPYWNVSLGIQRGKLVPKIKKDPDYLRKNGFEVVDRPGNVVSTATVSDEQLAQLNSGVLSIRQKPGPNNSLGLVKFVFPNEHNVYLHSTPAPELFSRTRRDFSHGCIRVEDPVALAEWILQGNGSWNKDKIVAAMNSGTDSQQMNLAQKRPVVIIYATSVVLPVREVRFFQDIYGHDAALEKGLAGGIPVRAEIRLPAPHPSPLKVHEVRSGVISHAPAMQPECRIAPCGGRDPRQANVDRLCQHVKTMPSHPGMGTAGPEKFVAPRCAIATDHVDLAARIVQGLSQVMEQVKQPRIEVMNIPGAVIAEKIVQPGQRGGYSWCCGSASWRRTWIKEKTPYGFSSQTQFCRND